jgi:hypothetical protein
MVTKRSKKLLIGAFVKKKALNISTRHVEILYKSKNFTFAKPSKID